MKTKIFFVLLFLTCLWNISCVDSGTLGLGIPQETKNGVQTLPFNVALAFAPTGFYWNDWNMEDSSEVRPDPDKLARMASYRSLNMKANDAGCAAPKMTKSTDTTIKSIKDEDTTFEYTEYEAAVLKNPEKFECVHFTYKPQALSDEYAGVMWLSKRNWGFRKPDVKIAAGARYITFWAKAAKPGLKVKFGMGILNFNKSPLWYTPYVDQLGNPEDVYKASALRSNVVRGDYQEVTIKKQSGKYVLTIVNSDTSVVVDDLSDVDTFENAKGDEYYRAKFDLPKGAHVEKEFTLNTKWRKYSIDLIDANKTIFDTTKMETAGEDGPVVLPEITVLGGFKWSIRKADQPIEIQNTQSSFWVTGIQYVKPE